MLKYETPGDFLFAQYKNQKEELNRLRRNNQKPAAVPAVNDSTSYRIGRMITFIPRKLKGFMWCVQDHGLRYTVKYGFRKLKNKLRRH